MSELEFGEGDGVSASTFEFGGDALVQAGVADQGRRGSHISGGRGEALGGGSPSTPRLAFNVWGLPQRTVAARSDIRYSVVTVVRRFVVAKGQPFSVRLQEDTERLVEAEARRTRRTKSAVVEAFTEETARTRRFPGIAFRGDDARRRAWVIGSGLDVWEIIQMLEDFGSSETLVAETLLSPAQVRISVAYRDSYPDEIANAISENKRPITDVRVLFPFVTVADA
ncbi:MAG TPA: hypothetical protein VLX59_15990 [Acidimicrobiales bacterium]|nr:hypothetical protein [Acidimicrobiales bacterium]